MARENEEYIPDKVYFNPQQEIINSNNQIAVLSKIVNILNTIIPLALLLAFILYLFSFGVEA